MEGYVLYGLMIIIGLVMFIFYAKRERSVISAMVGMGSGAAALIALHYFGEHIGFAPELNLFNTAVSLIMGVPGAAVIELVNIFAA